MVAKTLFKKLARDLIQRRWSLLALILIIAVGVSVYVSMSSVYLDLDSARQRYYNRYNFSHFTVNLKRAPEWTTKPISELPNIVRVRGRIRQAALLDLEHRIRPLPGVALSLPQYRDNSIDGVMLRSGIWFSHQRAKEAILDHQFAKANDIEPGDRIRVTLVDKQHDLLIVGTAMSPEFVYLIPPGGGFAPDPEGYGVMYLPRKFLQESSNLDGAYNQLLALVKDKSRSAIEDSLELVKAELAPYGVTVTTPIQDHPSASVLRDELHSIEATAAIFPVIFLAVAAMVLNILISRTVAQQRSVIGTLRALGYLPSAIVFHYLGFGLIIGLSGALLGMVLGWYLQVATLNMYKQLFAMPGIEPHLHHNIYVTGALIALFFSVAGAIKGSWVAAKLAPAEAMRPPPPEKGGKVLIERIHPLWKTLNFRWKMIFRAVFRNPIRSLVSVLASAVATALILSSFSMFDATYFLMDYHFKNVAHEDITLTVRNPKGESSAMEVSDLPLVGYSEKQLAVICDLTNGNYNKRTAVTGLDTYGKLYTPVDRAGRQLVIPKEGLALSNKLAEILNVQVGDQVTLRPLIAARKETRAPVVSIIDTFLGISAYCDIRYLSSLLGEQEVTNTYLIDSFALSGFDPLMAEVKKRRAVIGVTERQKSLAKMRETIGHFMASFFAIMIIFAGIIAFGGLLNTAMVSLSERQREVGTLRVIGYTSKQVWGVFSGEGFLLNGIGILVGLGLGVGFSHMISSWFDTEIFRFPVVIYPSRVILTIVLMLIFLILAQSVIYGMIRKLPWLEALKVKE